MPQAMRADLELGSAMSCWARSGWVSSHLLEVKNVAFTP